MMTSRSPETQKLRDQLIARWDDVVQLHAGLVGHDSSERVKLIERRMSSKDCSFCDSLSKILIAMPEELEGMMIGLDAKGLSQVVPLVFRAIFGADYESKFVLAGALSSSLSVSAVRSNRLQQRAHDFFEACSYRDLIVETLFFLGDEFFGTFPSLWDIASVCGHEGDDIRKLEG